MTAYNKKWRLTAIALVFIISAFFVAGMTAYAAETEPDTPLSVSEVWLTGDTLHVSVADGGEGRTIELNLRDYAMPGDEYVTIQATDENGRQSNSVTFKNPFFQAGADSPANGGADAEGNQSESAIPDGAGPAGDGRPLTPDGTGTVLDNVTDGDGKEFFTVETEDGNIFYLIVDRQRNSENVYLLNAVTEDDLMSLAKEGDGRQVSAIPEPPAPPATIQPEATPEPMPTPEPENNGGGNTGTLAFVGLAVLAIGGAAYYIKFVRPKRNGAEMSYPDPEDYENEDMDVEDDDEEEGEDI